MIYKTFEEWKAGQWLEDGEPRTEAYTEDELLLIEMGWKYGFDAGKAKTLTDEEWELLKKVALIAWGTANECSPCAEEFCKQSQSDMLNLLEKTGAELKAMIEKHEAILRKASEK